MSCSQVSLGFIPTPTCQHRSRAVWKEECQPILEAAGMQLKVVETQRPGHASGAVQKLELSEEVDAIVCVGGDGTMSEIVQVSSLFHYQRR